MSAARKFWIVFNAHMIGWDTAALLAGRSSLFAVGAAINGVALAANLFERDAQGTTA